MQQSTFNIYKASAGSGKTFTLVKEYLKILLNAKNGSSFQQILAVTFTNKAVNEMKQRVLRNLTELSKDTSGPEVSDIAQILVEELEVDSQVIQNRASVILQKILHNYAFFEISTIDKFTHRVIRSFAKDLRISQNFEVVLDTNLLLEEAINNLLSKAGEDQELTNVLIAFALEKTDADKHWDLSTDLFKVGKLLFSENDLPHIKTLESKNIGDFKALQKELRKEISETEREMVTIGEAVLQKISKEGFTASDFPNKTLPNHFNKILEHQFDPSKLYANTLEDKLRSGNIVKSGVTPPDPGFTEDILECYLDVKSLVFRRDFLLNSYRNVLPLTIINAISKELKIIENDRDLLPISSFNTLISTTIADQPAPFIYERLGEKYRHYFIDEFQDTSQMQWNNLVPLVANALEGQDEGGMPGSLMIVGDVKQAIYRWRGGKPEQLIDLAHSNNNPFTIEADIHGLQTNYRSRSEIVHFNSAFFKSAASGLNNNSYRQLYEKETTQNPNKKEGGYIHFDFLDESKNQLDESYVDRIRSIVEEARGLDYSYSDICILTRKRKHGVLISEGLTSLGLPVTSSETLLLKSSSKVLFLIDLLKIALDPDDADSRFRFLSFLIPEGEGFHQEISSAMENVDTWLKDHWQFHINAFKLRSVYDGLEQAISIFHLIDHSDAFITYLLDEVLTLEQKFEIGIGEFLEYWKINEEKLSVTAPANLEAVKIMTIHKAKGLEFPVVIYPYANSDIYEEIDPKLWIRTEPEKFEGFSELLLNKKKHLLNYSAEIGEIYDKDLHKQELDAFNVLYVALTRAIDALFIVTEKDLSASGIPKSNKYSGLFINFLKEQGLWEEDRNCYSIGSFPVCAIDQSLTAKQEDLQYIGTSKAETVDKLSIRTSAIWNTKRTDAIEKGNLVHFIMSQIDYVSGIETVFDTLIRSGVIKSEDSDELKTLVMQIINHPDLNPYFHENFSVRNEQDIITENGLILRPDRLVFREDEVVVIDYKTGAPNSNYHSQVRSYSTALEQMGFKPDQRILVYINDTINTEFI